MFTAAVAIEYGQDFYTTGAKLATSTQADITAKVPGADPSFGLLFMSDEFDSGEIVRGIRSVVPDLPIAGMSTGGELTGLGAASRDSAVLMLFASDTVSFYATRADGVAADSLSAGKILAEDITTHMPDAKLVMMMADGLTSNGSKVLQGLQSVLGERFPIVGGSAGDRGKFDRTLQVLNDTTVSDAVVGVGLNGPINVSVGVRHGWTPVGRPRIVTKADGAKIISVDNEPAESVMAAYLGDAQMEEMRTQTLSPTAFSYPLGILDGETGTFSLRSPFRIDPDGSIICGGDIPEGSEIQLMLGSKEEALAATKHATEEALAEHGQPPAAVILFSCYVRATMYGTNELRSQEVEMIKEVVGNDVPIIGGFTYAEQAPINGQAKNIKLCRSAYHNETSVVVLLSEKPSND